MKKSKARAPGKCIISGEYAVMFGHPAISASIDAWITATITAAPSPELRLLSGQDPLLRHALQSFLTYFHEAPRHLEISIESQLPIGSGFGSSAALIVSLGLALMDFFKISLADEEFLTLCRRIEDFQHGSSSGLDLATIYYGGLYHSQLGKLDFTLPPGFALLNTGRPSVNTGACVAKVKQDFPRDHEIWQRFAICSEKIFQALRHGHFDFDRGEGVLPPMPPHPCSFLRVGGGPTSTSPLIYNQNQHGDNTQVLSQLLTENEALLEIIGVVPEKIQTQIREFAAQGITAKISGAGAIAGDHAGLLLLFPEATIKSDFQFTNEGAHLV